MADDTRTSPQFAAARSRAPEVPVPDDDRLRALFRGVRDDLSSFVQRSPVAEGLTLSVLARQNVLLLGPPGTAKSLMAHFLCEHLREGRYFQKLLTKFTTPEELFGPLKITSLQQDRFERATTGYMPEAHVAFLDEVFKGSSAILNTLLTLLNERVFYNGNEARPCPLVLAVGASNETGDDDVAALYDRFLLRHELMYVNDANVVPLLCFKKPQTTVTFSTDDLDQARQAVMGVAVPDMVLVKLASIRQSLFQQGVFPSDRRLCQCVDLLKAKAWLEGQSVADHHLLVLEHALWATKEDLPKVSEILIGALSEELLEARSLLAKARAAYLNLLNKTRDQPRADKVRQMQEGFLEQSEPLLEKLEELAARTPEPYLAEVRLVHADLQDLRRSIVDAEG